MALPLQGEKKKQKKAFASQYVPSPLSRQYQAVPKYTSYPQQKPLQVKKFLLSKEGIP